MDAVDPDTAFSVEIDGERVRRLGRYRAHPEAFSAFVDPAGLLGFLGPLDVDPVAAGGYWLMTRPLKEGSHQIPHRARVLPPVHGQPAARS